MSGVKLGILGTGLMGKQVALLCASHNISVYMWNHISHPETDNELKKMATFQSRLGTLDKDDIGNID